MHNLNSKSARGLLFALAIIGCGFALRIYGLDFGLPFLYVGDEIDFVGRAFEMLVTGDPNPHWFNHPGTPTIYLFALIFAGKITAGSATLSDLFYLARFSVAVFAAGSMLLTYLIGRRVMDLGGALLATAIVAFAPLHVEFSRIARTDLQMAFFVLASTWFILSIAETGRRRDYVLAGFLLGLAAATKYLALILAISLIWAHCLHRLRENRPVWTNPARLIGSGLTTCLGFLAGTPFILLEYENAWRSLIVESRSFHLGATADGFLSSVWWYLTHPLLDNVGFLGMLMMLAGAGLVIARRNAALSVVLVFAVCAVIFHSFLSLRWGRWLIPALPFFALLAAFGFQETAKMLGRRLPESARPVAVFVALAVATLMLAGPATDSVQRARSLGNEDTRTLAFEWIMSNVAPGSRILSESYTPQLPNDLFRLYGVENGRIIPNHSSRYFFLPINNIIPFGSIGRLRDADAIDRARIDYVVLSSQYDRRRAEPFHSGQEAAYAETKREIDLYEELMDRYSLIYETWPVRGKIAGNHVRIYQTSPADAGTKNE